MGHRVLPSLDEPEPGSCCRRCGEPLRITNFCGACHEARLERLEAALEARAARSEAKLDEARRRARARHLANVERDIEAVRG